MPWPDTQKTSLNGVIKGNIGKQTTLLFFRSGQQYVNNPLNFAGCRATADSFTVQAGSKELRVVVDTPNNGNTALFQFGGQHGGDLIGRHFVKDSTDVAAADFIYHPIDFTGDFQGIEGRVNDDDY